ncbi:MAG: asparagine synthase (glutamine-hydrolyzing) [Candidatus Verstraetearchaeota archaeon]|nr:asparagine synthase (glutamine-hydrolyzing) [Candidatus Verstraetearchaeota archaeon]
MCGICGKINFDRQQPVDPELIRRMMDLLYHRGPDGGGMYCSGSIGLGHRRLSIIDLSTGNQPMCNETGTIWVVYNGEIYNFRDLRAHLEDKGHRFKSKSDTEVILHAFEEWGPESVKKLRGMFAFALWDSRRNMLLLARDRVGVKPLYYVNTGKGLVFASEIKAIVADQSVERRINPLAVDRFMTYGYLPGSETLIEGIFKLPPGHYLILQDGKLTVREYWDLHFKNPPVDMSFRDAMEELRVLLRQTVRDHMISDVPVGVLLSGGVDSTGVLRYAVEQTDTPIHTFTIGFSGEECVDERPYARLASKNYGTIHHEITMTANEFRDLLPSYVWHMEEPVFEPPAVALYCVARLARESCVKVLLSGEGGDEVFGGYQNYRNLLLLEKFKSLAGPAKVLLKRGVQAMGKVGWSRVGKYTQLINMPLSKYYLSRTEMPHSPLNKMKQTLYTKEFAKLVNGNFSQEPTRLLFDKFRDIPPLNSMLYVDTKTWLPDDLLIKADKMTMATSVELRVPLLDFQLIEFAASLPQSYKVRGWSTKRILKAALKDSVPKEIISRRKTGFPVPYEKWIHNELKSFVFETLFDRKTCVETYFSIDDVRKFIETSYASNINSKGIFCILLLELTCRAFVSS